jgi:hypothetical protein
MIRLVSNNNGKISVPPLPEQNPSLWIRIDNYTRPTRLWKTAARVGVEFNVIIEKNMSENSLHFVYGEESSRAVSSKSM